METEQIILNRELAELKHKVLLERIEKIQNTLKIISTVVDCQNEINSIEIIKKQYEKMYQVVLSSGEYDKYQEIENMIIDEISKVEAKIDRYIYNVSKIYDEILDIWFKEIRESENYKKFHKLDNELDKIKQLKAVFEYCKIYFSRAKENQINTKISTFKFELLIRRQIEQMIYENGTVHDGRNLSRLNQYDNQEEANCFCILLEKMMEPIKEDEVLKEYKIGQIANNNILLNHLLFKLIEQDIEINPEKYEVLLEARIFNPHMCNIANNPYTQRIPYLQGYSVDVSENPVEYLRRLDDPYRYYFQRDKANLSLLRAVLECAIKDFNTTIMECNNIYQRFGFECNPIVVSEGQEIVRRVFEKTKHKLKPSERVKEGKGQYVEIIFTGYDYKFEAKEEPFFTYAQMIHEVKNKKWKNEDRKQATERALGLYNSCAQDEYLFLTDMKILAKLKDSIVSEITGQSNDWRRFSLEAMRGLGRLERPLITRRGKYLGFGKYLKVQEYDETELWKSYKNDFKEMGFKIKAISHETSSSGNTFHTIAISLDDIADLPLDLKEIHILTEEERRKANKLEKEEEER